ncbi:MAG: glycine--tRNA ligase subunit beta [Bacillales bacterium]|jgi:glycyl-tRNA synthetase beta chain|nr:glycine--tRNA ligase subunit beta [Bacillales bacterium]
MNKYPLLLEIGLEDLPARYINESIEQLKTKVSSFLIENRIQFGNVTEYATPRRLALIITDIDEYSQSLEVEAKGPAKKIAQDADGNWTKAAIGFAAGQGATTDDLFFKEIKDVEYVYVIKKEEGKKTQEILINLSSVITSMTFPKSMRWGSEDLKFIRPIKWLICLLGENVVPLQISNIVASNITRGHRFLGENVTLTSSNEYVSKLSSQYVIADYNERKQLIINQINELESKNNWVIPTDSELLDEVINLVEYPTILVGDFDKSFLRIPDEVLITTMKEHQRYFPVKSHDGKLLPHFVTVRNGTSHALETVKKGNEKVLSARLSDAAFFYDEDQKRTIDFNLAKLKTVVFHEELGTITDKINRLTSASDSISNLLKLSDEEASKLERAASICKFDLVSNMVYEFPELQGIMGEKYSLIFGEGSDVATAINEHYMPRNSEDGLPDSNIGAALSILDKLDTIVGFFGIGLIPTGSQDPYALRRQAAGIVQILMDKNWGIILTDLVKPIYEEYLKNESIKKSYDELIRDITNFFGLRVKATLQEKNIRFDIIDAVIASECFNVVKIIKKGYVLQDELKNEGFKEILESLNRVINISKNGFPGIVNEQLLTPEELQLFNAIKEVEVQYHSYLKQDKFDQAFAVLKSLQPKINIYFDNVMVMTDDEQLKNNRLTMLSNISRFILMFANTSLINTK